MASKALPFSTLDEKAIPRQLRQFVSDRKYLERRWHNLMMEHGGEWVGVYRRETVFADSLEDLLQVPRTRAGIWVA